MGGSVLEDAFAHHVWATVGVIDACLSIGPEQLETVVPGTYGSILDTVRHLVGSDRWYLFTMTGDRAMLIDEDHMDLHELRAAAEEGGAAWSSLLAQDLDRNTVLTEVDEDDGYRKDATIGIRLAQALHHGTDHRSQVCTVLTTLGVAPPGIDVWNFGLENGRVVEFPPTH
ncbi:MAG TPA: DinB family protein [Actinomycetota bacterium]|nr:DinB family protein [Actinomycetota bacterium]